MIHDQAAIDGGACLHEAGDRFVGQGLCIECACEPVERSAPTPTMARSKARTSGCPRTDTEAVTPVSPRFAKSAVKPGERSARDHLSERGRRCRPWRPSRCARGRRAGGAAGRMQAAVLVPVCFQLGGAEPHDHLPSIQDERAGSRPLPGVQRTNVRDSPAVLVGHEAACGRIGHWHCPPPIRAMVNQRPAVIAVPLACH